MFALVILIMIVSSILAVWARIEGRKEETRLNTGDLKAEDFEIISETE